MLKKASILLVVKKHVDYESTSLQNNFKVIK